MARTALQIVQDAATKLSIAQPSALFSATDRTEVELREALIEAVDKILHAHNWKLLLTLETHNGDGSTTEFAKPSDYLKMPIDGQLWSSRYQAPLAYVTPEEWLGLDVRSYDIVSGTWSLFGGNFVYKPALASTETVKFWYMSDEICANSGGTAKAAFTADDDTFRLDDRVLELVFVWLWRSQKGLDYAEDMATAEIALARAIERDGGSQIIKQASSRRPQGIVAYPWSVST